MNTTDYSIRPEELGALRQLLSFQSRFGTKKIAEIDYGNYLGIVEQLALVSNQLKNPTLQTWIDTLYTGITAITDFDKMFVVFCYWRFCGSDPEPNESYEKHYSQDWTGMWFCFTRSWRYRDTGDFDNWVGGCYPNIPAPAVWKTKNDALRNTWFDNPPPSLIDKGIGSLAMNLYQRCRGVEQKLLDAWWKQIGQSVESNKSMWTKQMELFTSMKGPNNTTVYTASDYFFLFHLLIALPTKGDSSARLENFIKQSNSSMDYENETFINHLIFLVMLFLANPNGTYKYNNAQLKDFVKISQDIIHTNTKLDEALKSGLAKNLIRLTTDSHYPYVTDNYDERVLSTLGVLNAMKLSPAPAGNITE